MFSPVVGNGHHNQVGAGLDAHHQLWKNDCGHSLDMYVNGYVASALPNCQVRSFDFKNKGCLSRYMLLKELNSALTTTNQYTANSAGNIINGINFSTRFTNVKINVIGDAALRFVYRRDNFDFGIGYNVYGQSKESVCIVTPTTNNPCNILDPSKIYGFKGCTGVASYQYPTDGSMTTGPFTTVVYTKMQPQIKARLLNAVLSDNPLTNTSMASGSRFIDWHTNVDGNQANSVPVDTPLADVVIASTSLPALQVTVKDLDVNSGKAPKQITHKGFVTANWTWQDCANKPYIGLGAEVEGGSKCSLKQWGLWLKGGVTF